MGYSFFEACDDSASASAAEQEEAGPMLKICDWVIAKENLITWTLLFVNIPVAFLLLWCSKVLDNRPVFGADPMAWLVFLVVLIDICLFFGLRILCHRWVLKEMRTLLAQDLVDNDGRLYDLIRATDPGAFGAITRVIGYEIAYMAPSR